MDDKESHDAERHLRHLIEVAVIHMRAVLHERIFVSEGLAWLDRLLVQPAYPVHAVWLGDRFQYNGSVSYRIRGRAGEVKHKHAHPQDQTYRGNHLHGFEIDIVLELNGERQAREVISGATNPNSGGNVVYLSPGLRLTSSRTSGFLSFGIPIVNDLNGRQSEASYRVVGGLVLAFD
jgi:hypothetical protein